MELTNNSATEFMDLKPKEFKNLYFLYLDLLAAGQKSQSIIHSLSERMEASYGFPSSIAQKVAKLVYNQFSSPTFATHFIDVFDMHKKPLPFEENSQDEQQESPQKLFLSTLDMERYNKLVSVDPHASLQLKRLLLALMSVYRRNFHKSGWVRYDKKLVFYLAGLQDLPVKESEELTQYLHQEYGFDMQVVGSNSPIPCFKMDWLFDQPQPGSHINAFLEYGDFTPETIVQITCGTVKPKTIN